MLDGTYTATVLVTISSEYTLSIRVGGPDGIPIADSPFYSRVLPGDSSVSNLKVEVPDQAKAGTPFTLTAQTRDRYGNMLISGGASIRTVLRTSVGEGLDQISLAVIYEGNGSRPIHDHGNGKYSAAVSLTVAGKYDVSVVIGGKAGHTGTLAMSAADRTHGPACTPSGTGWIGTFWNREAVFTVQARDEYGNARAASQGDKFLLQIGEVQMLNTTGSLVLASLATGTGHQIKVISQGTGENALALFGE
jgi:hypothetical protein